MWGVENCDSLTEYFAHKRDCTDWCGTACNPLEQNSCHKYSQEGSLHLLQGRDGISLDYIHLCLLLCKINTTFAFETYNKTLDLSADDRDCEFQNLTKRKWKIERQGAASWPNWPNNWVVIAATPQRGPSEKELGAALFYSCYKSISQSHSNVSSWHTLKTTIQIVPCLVFHNEIIQGIFEAIYNCTVMTEYCYVQKGFFIGLKKQNSTNILVVSPSNWLYLTFK